MILEQYYRNRDSGTVGTLRLIHDFQTKLESPLTGVFFFTAYSIGYLLSNFSDDNAVALITTDIS